ncbi:MAG: CapA family protein [Halobacteriota archaeon]
MGLRLGFTGDVMLGRGVDRRQRRRPTTAVWGDLLDDLRSLDGLFINLECAIAAAGEPWTRTDRAFRFRADPSWAIDALVAAGVDGATLANNHALDFEVAALLETLEHLEGAGIAVVGAGATRRRACEPVVVDLDGLRVGLVGYTDNTPEYGAREDAPGTCQGSIGEARDTLMGALERLDDVGVDLVVATVHWGPNMTTAPTADRRDLAHWLVDRGVDVVHGHSAHVFHGVEVYDGRPILYDTGDFVDDYAVDDRLRNDRCFLFVIEVTADGTPRSLELTPTVIEDGAVHRATGETAAWCRRTMRERSAPFGTTLDREGDGIRVDLGG